jgi:hypothetical protein
MFLCLLRHLVKNKPIKISKKRLGTSPQPVYREPLPDLKPLFQEIKVGFVKTSPQVRKIQNDQGQNSPKRVFSQADYVKKRA